MRLAIDVTPLIGARTGVGVATAGIIGALATRLDLDITGYALTWRGRDDLRSQGLPASVRLPRLPMAARPLRQVWTRADLPPIEMWTGAVDVVHGTNYVVPPSRRAGRLVTVYDLTFLHYPEMCTADTLAYPGLIRRAVARGAWVHTSSQAIAAEIADAFPAAADRIGVVPLGLDPLVAPSGEPVHPFPYVLALGTVEPRKGLPTLVAAFDEVAGAFPDLRLVIAGPDGWGTREYDASVGRSAFRDRILREGFVSDERRSALLAGATVFAYPSVYEGFGLPPLEAMSLGVPVVASTAGSLPEVLGDAAAMVAPGDVGGLAGALGRLLGDDTGRAELAARGRGHAARYSWDACGSGLASLYEAVERGR